MGTTNQTIGLDLGDKYHHFCILDREGAVIQEGRISSTPRSLATMFSKRLPATASLEAGTHSPWVSQALEGWGHAVLVGNPRKLRAIYSSAAKCDERDAQMLARMARFDPQLLSPIRHRGPRARSHLAILKSRDILVKSRSMMINHCRGVVKSLGAKLPSFSAESFARKAKEHIPDPLRAALDPVLGAIEDQTEKIKRMDREIAALCEEEYLETEGLRAIKGVGPVTSLAFVLTLEEPSRFAKSRSVPVYLGLTPRRDQSGEVDKQLRITKAGDKFLRRLLVSCAHYILGPFGDDSDLRRWGERMCARGGKNAKKRAVVAVARKLAALLHHLWVSGETYTPFHNSRSEKRRAERAAGKERADVKQRGKRAA